MIDALILNFIPLLQGSTGLDAVASVPPAALALQHNRQAYSSTKANAQRSRNGNGGTTSRSA
jgi:hypothetical protein